jgi:hypothetical protein
MGAMKEAVDNFVQFGFSTLRVFGRETICRISPISQECCLKDACYAPFDIPGER